MLSSSFDAAVLMLRDHGGACRHGRRGFPRQDENMPLGGLGIIGPSVRRLLRALLWNRNVPASV